MSFFEKLMKVDRRIIFILIFIGVAIPMFFVLDFFIEITDDVLKVYNLVEETPAGTLVLISFDYGPSTKPELQPMADAVIEHALGKNLKLICIALWPMGVQMCAEVFEKMTELFPDIKYGEDYVTMGYKAGGIVTMRHMAKDFRGTFPTDEGGTPIDELPILNDINNLEKFGFVFGLSAGDPGIKQWVMVAHDDYGRPVAGGTTAVSAPSILPYINEQKQLIGLLGGLKGAAEYEKLIDRPAFATKGMDAQSIAHLIIILFIIVGNVGYFVTKKSKGV